MAPRKNGKEKETAPKASGSKNAVQETAAPKAPPPEITGPKLPDITSSTSPAASDDDEPWVPSEDLRAKMDKVLVSQTVLRQTVEDFEKFVESLPISDADMEKAKDNRSLVDKKADKASQALKTMQKKKIAELHEIIDDVTFKREQEALEAAKAQFCMNIDAAELLARDRSYSLVYNEMANFGVDREIWMAQQPQFQTFWADDSNQVLIVECFDPDDLNASPLESSAMANARQALQLGGFVTYMNGNFQPEFKPTVCLLLLIAKIVAEGWDPDIKLPTAKEMKEKGFNREIAFKGFLMSHLRISECTVIFMGIGALEHDKAATDAWVKICNSLITLAKARVSGLKPFRLLLVNADQSAVVKQIKQEHDDIPILQCPTGAEFHEQYETHSVPKVVKKGKKDGKKKEGAA